MKEENPPTPDDFHSQAVKDVQQWRDCVAASTIAECVRHFQPQQLVKGMYAQFLPVGCFAGRAFLRPELYASEGGVHLHRPIVAQCLRDCVRRFQPQQLVKGTHAQFLPIAAFAGCALLHPVLCALSGLFVWTTAAVHCLHDCAMLPAAAAGDVHVCRVLAGRWLCCLRCVAPSALRIVVHVCVDRP